MAEKRPALLITGQGVSLVEPNGSIKESSQHLAKELKANELHLATFDNIYYVN
ncbi:hypothetical protein [Convivina intestini]|uniref:hypothetical protein n=1 Tax=Convivina intestini TaxID=1505726 RepID=UPI0014028A64|nr:hypothetical protein [Convivina intestini]